MIPALSTMIGAYIIFRMFEVWFFSTARYSGKIQHIVMAICAGFVGLFVFIAMIEVWQAGAKAGGIAP